MPLLRDRIRELRRVPANQLRPHPRNWRVHSAEQRAALAGLLEEIGYAGALLARELPDGGLELIDGHLRADRTPDQLVPVLVLDVTEEESLKLLAAYDPLSAMAGADPAQLASLLVDVRTGSAGLQALFDGLAAQSATQPARAPAPAVLDSSFEVLVHCASEDEQRSVYERLVAEGFRCRLLTM